MANRKDTKFKNSTNLGLGIALGITFGAAFKNIGLGLAIGIAIGAGLDNKKSKNKEE